MLRVTRETDDAVSIAIEVDPALAGTFAYRAGQFVNVKVRIDGEEHIRSYSMSSAPGVDPELQVTVKRVPGGLVSNWLHDNVAPGDLLDVNPPLGAFVLDDGDRDVIAFAAGSGITPVFSILVEGLATSGRRFRLLFANRDRASTIFADALDRLASQHPDRFELVHHFDTERGFVDGASVTEFVGHYRDADVYLCGPTPFMDVVQATLTWNGVPPHRLHVERFTPPEEAALGETDEIEVEITFRGRTVRAPHRANATILHVARGAGLRPPTSCETGTCATCMARVVEGRVEMRRNDALTPEEVADGWVLTCQAVPVTPAVKVVYE